MILLILLVGVFFATSLFFGARSKTPDSTRRVLLVIAMIALIGLLYLIGSNLGELFS